MFQTFINIFRVPELRNKVLFTLFMLAVYRLGYHVPLPGVDQASFAALAKQQQNNDAGAAGRLASYVSIFSGGNLSQSTIFGLGVMPYISASIIFQLLGTVVPALEKMQKEGETGRKRIQEWTRYTTVPLALIQGVFWLTYMHHPGAGSLVQKFFVNQAPISFWVMGLSSLVAGCVFLMWLGEQIDEYGLGNGVSLIILAGIVARMPAAIGETISLTNLSNNPDPVRIMTPPKILFLIASFVFIVAGSILITQAQRRIPIQQAKHTRGRRVYGGQKQYLPLRVNHGGVMPIIFAQSLMLFPGVALGWLSTTIQNNVQNPGFFSKLVFFFNAQFGRGSFVYIVTEIAMIYFFAYFWTTVQFQPKEMASQLRDYGSFIPGLRPGKRTSDYLEKVMMRITYVGAAFLCVIAVVPTAVSSSMQIPFQITAFLGGTGLLIVVSVALDMVQRIEANLLMRNYGGFLGGEGKRGKRIKGRQY
jgi:preprotein translocase subunit SecY